MTVFAKRTSPLVYYISIQSRLYPAFLSKKEMTKLKLNYLHDCDIVSEFTTLYYTFTVFIVFFFIFFSS